MMTAPSENVLIVDRPFPDRDDIIDDQRQLERKKPKSARRTFSAISVRSIYVSTIEILTYDYTQY